MYQPPNLLNEDGTASMATLLMLSHHAFRRDMARFLRAMEQIKSGDLSHAQALREEWNESYHPALHGHHTVEDNTLFPDIKNKHPESVDAVNKLAEQHHKIDPILEKGDLAFARLEQDPEEAAQVLKELSALIHEHLDFEEAQVTPFLRDAKQFPTPKDEDSAAMYAEGFAWSMQGIAPEVIEEVNKLLPDILLSKLPEARAKFEERSARIWGDYKVGSATTPIPTIY